jgi:hypothetical protein
MKHDGGDREMADILALVLHHDEALVEQAVSEAMINPIINIKYRGDFKGL